MNNILIYNEILLQYKHYEINNMCKYLLSLKMFNKKRKNNNSLINNKISEYFNRCKILIQFY